MNHGVRAAEGPNVVACARGLRADLASTPIPDPPGALNPRSGNRYAKGHEGPEARNTGPSNVSEKGGQQ